MRSWVILTPELPPAVGGVADYVAGFSRGLADAGDSVRVFAPAPARNDLAGVSVSELAKGFDAVACAEIARQVSQLSNPTVLVQYVPLRLGKLAAVRAISRLPGELWVMFHEVAFPLALRQSTWRRTLGLYTHLAAGLLLRRAERTLISTPWWEGMLRPLGPTRTPPLWFPIPSNIPFQGERRAREEVLRAVGLDPTRPTVGHFSAIGPQVRASLEKTLSVMLRREANVQALLIGRASREVAAALSRSIPGGDSRIAALGEATPEAVADALGAVDVALQPYSDGIGARRTSAMAALSLGKAVVTTSGPATEPVWQREQLVEIAESTADAMATSALGLLADPARRVAFGLRARRAYDERFSMERVVRRLRAL